MRDVAEWLGALGLDRYVETFAENEIDFDVLPYLTDDDLKSVGISLGARRKLLSAISTLPLGERAPEAPGQLAEAERRHLSIMFADMVGSTALSEKLDPEEMHQVIRAYQNTVAGEIARFGGHVVRFLGDGALAYFGWPSAHEDDAERAVRAGLAVVEAVGKLTAANGQALKVRVGIATGLVVVGDLASAGAPREDYVIGEAPNLAARLQALAAPDTVVIAPSAYRLVNGLFECVDLGEHDLKGFERPVRAWQVISERATLGRFQARLAAGLTPLINREDEVACLLERWRRATRGEGQVVLLRGEPGIGKSRIVQALQEQLGGEIQSRLFFACSPFYTNRPLYPVTSALERLAGLARDDGTEAKLEKLEALLCIANDSVNEDAPLFADLLSIPNPDRYAPLDLSPERQKDRTLDAIVNQLAGLASQRPFLAIFEDAHWMDPTSWELLDRVVARIKALPILLLVVSRTECTRPWVDDDHVTSLTLTGLSREQSAGVVNQITGNKSLPPEVLGHVLSKTDGVPLFIEELTKMILEAGYLRELDDRYALGRPLGPLEIPETLQDSLMARLDRSVPARELAQIGATIGREFSYDLLAAVSPLRGPDLRETLDVLLDADLIVRHGTPNQETFAFSHALLRDAAYSSLLHSNRQQIHARIASTIEERFEARSESDPEFVGHHWSMAQVHDKAIVHFVRAADRAKAAFANDEAIALYRRSIELANEIIGADPRKAGKWLDLSVSLHERLADVLALVRRQDEAVDEYQQALTIAPKDDAIRRARLYRGLGLVNQHHREDALRNFDAAEAALGSEPDGASDEWRQEWIHIQIGRLWVHYWKGEEDAMSTLIARVQPYIEHGTALQRAELFDHIVLVDFRRHRYVVSDRTITHARSFIAAAEETRDISEVASARFTLGFALLFRGDLDEAEHEILSALELARKSGHRAIEIRCVTYLGTLYRRRRQIAPARRFASESLSLAMAADMQEYVGMARANLAWAAWRDRDLATVETEGRAALECWKESPVAYPFGWTATLPLIAAMQARKTLSDVPPLCRGLLKHDQQRLPLALESAIGQVIAGTKEGSVEPAQVDIERMVHVAEDTGYL